MIWPVLFWIGALVIVGSYGGYGMWMAWKARFRPAPCKARYAADDELPHITCVIAAWNEAATIGRKLTILAHQDYPQEKVHVIVVSDGSTDGTDAVVERWARSNARVRLIRLPQRLGKPSALNAARGSIDTGIAVFMDTRQDLSPRALQDLVACLADPEVGAVSGRLRVKGDGYWTYEGWIRKSESRSGSMVQVTGSLYAMRTADIPLIPPATILDDVYVPLGVALGGKRIVMAEGAESIDTVTRSVGSEFLRKVRTLAGLVQICHMLPASLDPRANPVWTRWIFHKLSRLACPYALFLVLIGSLLAPGWFYRAVFAAACVPFILAAFSGLGIQSKLSRISQSLLAMNAAALWAPASYYLGRSAVTWVRVETDRK